MPPNSARIAILSWPRSKTSQQASPGEASGAARVCLFKTRSLIVLAMLTVLDCPEQIRLHVGGALRNGADEEEIHEVFVQAAAYAGFPKAHRAIQAAFAVICAFRGNTLPRRPLSVGRRRHPRPRQRNGCEHFDHCFEARGRASMRPRRCTAFASAREYAPTRSLGGFSRRSDISAGARSAAGFVRHGLEAASLKMMSAALQPIAMTGPLVLPKPRSA